MQTEHPESLDALTDSYLAYLQFERGLTDQTLAAYGADCRRAVAFLAQHGATQAREVGPELLSDFLEHERQRGLTPTTITRRIATLRGLFRFASEELPDFTPPTRRLELPKKPLMLPKVLTVKEVRKLLKAPDGATPLEVRDRALLHLLYATGARVSEACKLTVRDVDTSRGAAAVHGKGRKERIVPINAEALRQVACYLESARPQLARDPEDALFLSRTGRRLARGDVFELVRRYASAAGLRRFEVTPHTLRHCFATHMIENGADIRVVQEMLGHVDINTTAIYTHVTQKRLRRILNKCHPFRRRPYILGA